jgi:hypothetical protein
MRATSMMRRDRHQTWRKGIVLALLALLGGGVAAHAVHHLLDPDCGSAAVDHPCLACAGLHGGLTEVPAAVLLAGPSVLLEGIAARADDEPRPAAHRARLSRGPPAA